MKCADLALIRFPVCQLLLDLFDCGMPSFIEPGRELICTVLAEISVFKLSVSVKLYLLTAYITDLFFKHFPQDTHSYSPYETKM